jgi:hypothetical protein
MEQISQEQLQDEHLHILKCGLNKTKLPLVPMASKFKTHIRLMQRAGRLPEPISKFLSEGMTREIIYVNVKLPNWAKSIVFDVTKIQLLRLFAAGVLDLENENREYITKFVTIASPHLDLLRRKRRFKRRKGIKPADVAINNELANIHL